MFSQCLGTPLRVNNFLSYFYVLLLFLICQHHTYTQYIVSIFTCITRSYSSPTPVNPLVLPNIFGFCFLFFLSFFKISLEATNSFVFWQDLVNKVFPNSPGRHSWVWQELLWPPLAINSPWLPRLLMNPAHTPVTCLVNPSLTPQIPTSEENTSHFCSICLLSCEKNK